MECYIWNGRSEVVQRLLAQECEICGATDNIEVHDIRKLADIKQKGCKQRPEWMLKMSARKRKTLGGSSSVPREKPIRTLHL